MGGTFALTLLAATPAAAFVVKRTPDGDLVHWEEESVSYTFAPSVAANVPGAVDAATTAMASWSGTVGAPELAGRDARDVEDAPAGPGLDRKNGVFFFPEGYGPAGKALAITVLTYDNRTGRILDADIIVNGAYRFAVLGSDHAPASTSTARPSSTDGIGHGDQAASAGIVYDLHHVLAHELGHSLGLNDELVNQDALMYRYTSPNSTAWRAPGADDVDGLAELYSSKLAARGNGCQSSAVAAKKPSAAASELALAATLAFLSFLVLRGRTDRRARLAFVVGAALAACALLPSITGPEAGVARASAPAPGDARARVLGTSVTMEDGLLRTTFQLATTACRAARCPRTAEGATWGGTAGNIRQEVGSQHAPSVGEDVDVTFDAVATSLAPLASPLGALQADAVKATVRVLTKAVY
ncbi:MAG: hypothetical protein JWP97_5202 [Labilithrix sp.]|nr:hypothetical protein [Labilithrix sp.]